MDEPVAQLRVCAYEAQTVEGTPMRGTIEALDAEDAREQLRGLGVRVLELRHVESDASAKPRALRGDDFAAFNQQLASLTEAGLPLEKGL